MEGAELYGDTGANADERREGSFVEGKSALFCVDLLGRDEGGWVLGCGLQADFYYVEGLAWVGVSLGRYWDS